VIDAGVGIPAWQEMPRFGLGSCDGFLRGYPYAERYGVRQASAALSETLPRTLSETNLEQANWNKSRYSAKAGSILDRDLQVASTSGPSGGAKVFERVGNVRCLMRRKRRGPISTAFDRSRCWLSPRRKGTGWKRGIETVLEIARFAGPGASSVFKTSVGGQNPSPRPPLGRLVADRQQPPKCFMDNGVIAQNLTLGSFSGSKWSSPAVGEH
jgi:hypothetical protein